MRKIKTLLLLAIFPLLAISCTTEDNPFGPVASNHAIKSETKWELNTSSGSRLHKIYYKEFDKNDNLLVYIEYDNKDKIVSKSDYIYKNFTSTETITTFNESGSVLTSVKNVYNFTSDGKITQKENYNSLGELQNKEVYQYDSKGNVEKKMEYNHSGSLVSSSVYTYVYNSAGAIVERKISQNTGNTMVNTSETLLYNPDKNRVDIINYNGEGSKQTTISYIYNSLGHVAFQSETNPAGVLINKYEFAYEYFE